MIHYWGRGRVAIENQSFSSFERIQHDSSIWLESSKLLWQSDHSWERVTIHKLVGNLVSHPSENGSIGISRRNKNERHNLVTWTIIGTY